VAGPHTPAQSGEGAAGPPSRPTKGGGGYRGWAARLAGPRAWPGRKGRRGKEKKEKVFPFKIYFLDEWFHSFTQSKQMHGSAWCSKQKKVFLGFCFTRDLKPNLAITLEKIKA
jgi:hypothetical protein